MDVVVADCLLNVPLLANVPLVMLLSKALLSVKVPVLVNTPPIERPIALLPFPVLPVQVVLPAFMSRPPVSVLVSAPLMVSEPENVVLCVVRPVMLPPVQVAGPVKT